MHEHAFLRLNRILARHPRHSYPLRIGSSTLIPMIGQHIHQDVSGALGLCLVDLRRVLPVHVGPFDLVRKNNG